MRRIIALALVFCLLLTGCSSSSATEENMISGVGELQFSAESSEYEHQEEFPPSYTEISRPEESSSTLPQSSSSQVQESSSQQPQQSSSSQSQSLPEESSSSSSSSSTVEEEQEEQPSVTPAVGDEISAVWVSYLDLAPMLTGKTKSQFTSNIGKAFDKIADTGFNTVIVQVRPFADALYQSDYFPWSYLCTGTEGEDPGYDPLDIMVDAAHDRGLEIEAWLNPYRVRSANYTKKLCDDNQASVWLDEGSDAVVEYGGGIYYNPASEDARELILSGVEEIVDNYDVDGIHMDDYFYPNPDKSFDADSYADYDGPLSLGNWRRQNVNTLVRDIYSTVKNSNSSVRFGISPTGNNDNNYSQQYADVKKWAQSSGYVDYICPQIYWGYDHASMPYAQTVEDWDDIITHSSVKLIVGIGAYRLGEAGEWSGTNNILARMVETARKADSYGGTAMYRYD
ncbi:MAG: family 10 glycosylhydrolase, partial [Oscillospiraceae bacterium]|nr:family 10 glycosylhydrolase [Oscillospiraceae bacterium]